MHRLEADRPRDYLSRLAASELGRAYKSLVVDQLCLCAGASVADLGCGPGADLSSFAHAVGPTGRVVGIDHDPAAVAQATAAVLKHPQVEVSYGDVQHLDLADESMDAVHTDRVLQHVLDPGAAVRDAARTLRAGGVAVFAEPDWDTLVIDHPDPSIPRAYRRFITDAVVRNATVGRRLPGLCEAARLTVQRVIPVTAVFRDVRRADQVLGFRRVTQRAVAAAYLTEAQAAAWLTHLTSEPFFASTTMFVTVAERSMHG